MKTATPQRCVLRHEKCVAGAFLKNALRVAPIPNVGYSFQYKYMYLFILCLINFVGLKLLEWTIRHDPDVYLIRRSNYSV